MFFERKTLTSLHRLLVLESSKIFDGNFLPRYHSEGGDPSIVDQFPETADFSVCSPATVLVDPRIGRVVYLAVIVSSLDGHFKRLVVSCSCSSRLLSVELTTRKCSEAMSEIKDSSYMRTWTALKSWRQSVHRNWRNQHLSLGTRKADANDFWFLATGAGALHHSRSPESI
jgi:hypothetical protein